MCGCKFKWNHMHLKNKKQCELNWRTPKKMGEGAAKEPLMPKSETIWEKLE